MAIPSVSADEWIVGSIELGLTGIVREVKSFEVFNKDVFCDVFNSRHIPTFVQWLKRKIILGRGVSYNLLPPCSIFCFDGSVVIALDPKVEVTSSDDHFVVSLFVFIELFEVGNVAPNLTAAYGNYQV
jgi:hypothetical protein